MVLIIFNHTNTCVTTYGIVLSVVDEEHWRYHVGLRNQVKIFIYIDQMYGLMYWVNGV